MVTPICRGCGQPIRGRYITALGADWHPEHFCCAAGDGPITGQFREREGWPYHEACYIARFVPRCCIGGESLTGGWLTNAWGQTFCQAHGDACPHCRFCDRLIPAMDGVADRCPVCQAAAVTAESDARARFAGLVHWAAAAGMTAPAGTRIHVELTDRAHLNQDQVGRGQPEALGRTYKTTFSLNGRITRVQPDKVAVERGLPAPLFEGVALHELGHAWLACQQVSGLPLWAEEGFCELLAYHWYQGQDTPVARFYAKQIKANPDPIYGGGFRQWQVLAERLGLPAVIAQLQHTKTLPLGLMPEAAPV